MVDASAAETDHQNAVAASGERKRGHHVLGVVEREFGRPGEVHLRLDGVRAVEAAVEDQLAVAVGGVPDGNPLEFADDFVDESIRLRAGRGREQSDPQERVEQA
jgi:hypothetical protein